MTNDELSVMWSASKNWYQSAIQKLTESQLVEYRRQLVFFQSTAATHRDVGDSLSHLENQQKTTDKKRTRYEFVALVLIALFLFALPFFTNENASNDTFFAIVFIAGLYVIEREISKSRSHSDIQNYSAMLIMLERDINATGVSLTTLKKRETLWKESLAADTDDTQAANKRLALQRNLIDYAVRYEIFQAITDNEYNNYDDWYMVACYAEQLQ